MPSFAITTTIHSSTIATALTKTTSAEKPFATLSERSTRQNHRDNLPNSGMAHGPKKISDKIIDASVCEEDTVTREGWDRSFERLSFGDSGRCGAVGMPALLSKSLIAFNTYFILYTLNANKSGTNPASTVGLSHAWTLAQTDYLNIFFLAVTATAWHTGSGWSVSGDEQQLSARVSLGLRRGAWARCQSFGYRGVL